MDIINSSLPQLHRTAEKLENRATIDLAKPSSFGAVSEISFRTLKRGIPNSFSVTLDNSGGVADKKYLIGDPDGIIADLLSGEALNAADSGTVSPAVMNKLLRNKLSVGSMNYEVSLSTAQYAKNIKFYSGDLDGNLNPVNLGPQISSARRNTAFNSKLLTLEFPDPMVFDEYGGLYIVVAAGETVVLTFTPNGAIR